MSRLLKNARNLAALRKALGFGGVFAATKFNFGVEYTAKVDFKNALVLAPHPNDETFGMGGTIKKMVTAGSEVRVAFFTDGSAEMPEGVAPEDIAEQKVNRGSDMIAKKKEEAKKACEILGVKETFFWGYRDSQLAGSSSAMKALGDLINQVKPDIIFLPSFLDNHPDHRAANEIFLNTISALANDQKNFEVWAYEIWTPIFVNRLVDITLYIKTKEEAIRAYESEFESRRFDKAITALNQYRAEINNVTGFCEGFFASSIELYKELYERS